MISNVLRIFERGIQVMRSNYRLALVGVLVFVFPLLFIWITQSFFTSAYDNIHTAQKQRVGMVHDTITALLLSDIGDVDVLIRVVDDLALNNTDISKISVYKKTGEGFLIEAAVDLDSVGTIDSSVEVIDDIGFSKKLNFQQFEYIIDGKRTWQTFKQVPVAEEMLYIFTEFDLSEIDATMNYRRQLSYFGLTAILLFLMILAYWLNRQTNWEKNHEDLTRQMEERDLFSSMIAHEFRTPLTAIKGYSSFLQGSKSLTIDELRFASNIRTSSERLVILVNDFLEVTRLQSGKLSIKESEIDLRTVLKSVADDLKKLAEDKGLKLIYSQDAHLVPIILMTDSSRMTQVLTNIISNSVKYTDKGIIEIEAVQARGEVTIRIKDTGTGISADDQQKLFTPFTRVGGVDSGSVTGTGLGMWITRQIVTILGGKIGVESIEGVGTHVVIAFKT